METKESILQRVFGYSAFRGGQEALIDAQLQGRDAFGIMPTGGGKSLCYQIPALLLEGVTLVISPLISLMRDQVMALKNAGVAPRGSLPYPARWRFLCWQWTRPTASPNGARISGPAI